MAAMFRAYLIASIVFALSCGSTIKINELPGNELDRQNELDSSSNIEQGEIIITRPEDISEKTPHSSDNSCPVHPKPADCGEVYENGFKLSGIYKIYPKNKVVSCGEIKVYCDMRTDGGGWTVIQRRGNFKRSTDYFYKTWNEYKTGFGSLETEFWLGNDNIYALTNQKRYSIRFDLGTTNETAYATYDTFWIENEELKYKLNIADYSGTAGDSMSDQHKSSFSTRDRKNNPANTDCANVRKSGWWFNDCTLANLNGLYLKGNYNRDIVSTNGTYWRDWKGFKVSLASVEIKIRPFAFQK